MSKKVYELSDLNSLKYENICGCDLSNIDGGMTTSCVLYNDEYYTTEKNIELGKAHAKILELSGYIGSIENIGDDIQIYQADLFENIFNRLAVLITQKYGCGTGFTDDLYNCVIDPDDNEEFLSGH